MYVRTCLYPSLVLSRQEVEREAALNRHELEEKLQIQEKMVCMLHMYVHTYIVVVMVDLAEFTSQRSFNSSNVMAADCCLLQWCCDVRIECVVKYICM